MNNKLLIGITILILVAGGLFVMQRSNPASEQAAMIESESTDKDAMEETMNDDSMNNEGGIIGSIKDAMTGSASIICEYIDESSTATAYIKNGAVRFNSEGYEGQYGGMIHMDNTTYVWDEDQGSGFIFHNEEGVQVEQQPGTSEMADTDSVIESIEQFKENCRFATVSDDMFTPPSDIEFVDFADFQNLQDPEQLKKLQEQFGQ